MSSSNNSSGASKILLAFFGGMAAGITAGFYLNSEHGRQLRQDTVEKLTDFEARIEEKVKSSFNQEKKTAKKFASKAESKADDVKNKAEEVKNKAEKIHNETARANV